jgi:methylated-DNA-[protein]-cysteine S-methyltransferase
MMTTTMSERGFCLFDTPIGRCGIAWGARGVTGVQLPEGPEPRTRARMQRRFPGSPEGAPPPEVARAIEGISALLRGQPCDLQSVALDMDGLPPFHQRVYRMARAIGPGKTVSYGEVATRLGAPGSARAVGQALGRNPFAVIVPCHRVLAARGRVGGFSANGGVDTKLRMLALEAAAGSAGPGDDGGFPFVAAGAVAKLRAGDRGLARLIDRVGAFRMRLDRAQSLFLALAEAIVYQQLTGKAAATIFARVRALFPGGALAGPTPEQILRAPDEKLRGAGLSGAKLLALRDLAARTRAGTLPTLDQLAAMDDEAIIERLIEVRGIGRWTAEMLLMFRLGRPDVLPVDDYGIRKGFAATFRKRALPDKQELLRRGERWRPYRTVACWYLWRAAELAGPASPARGW